MQHYLLVLFIFSLGVQAQNSYPFVLVHGFAGWGRNELLGLKYWGGLQGDLQQYFINQGIQVVTVQMGPVSSNWDRACEMFAELRGGQVDYGLVHSKQNQHARFGRNYTALIPNWGPNQKVHLIAHSQGGQDARLLVSLLNNGSPDEIAGTPAAELSPLFKGGNDWVASVTTLNSPHDGTTLASGVGYFGNIVKDLVGYIASLDGIIVDNMIYDFMLDQFGLQRMPGESFTSYENRVLASSIFLPGQKDTALWSLQPEGASQLNGFAKAVSNVFYFTYNADSTYTGLNGDAYPDAQEIFVLWPFSTFMGAFTRAGGNGLVAIDSTWFHNDGVVNSRSGKGPTLNTTDVIVPLNQSGFTPGIFNYVELLNTWDHISLIGFGAHLIYPLYTQIVKVAQSLPTTAQAGQVSSINFALQTNFTQVTNATTSSNNCTQGIHTYYGVCSGTNNAAYFSFNTTQCTELANQLKTACNVTVTIPQNTVAGEGSRLNLFLGMTLFLVWIAKTVDQ